MIKNRVFTDDRVALCVASVKKTGNSLPFAFGSYKIGSSEKTLIVYVCTTPRLF